MKHFNRFYSLALVLLCLLLSACGAQTDTNLLPKDGDESAQTYLYTQASVSFDDPNGNIAQDKYGWETVQNGFTFRFTGKISEEERDDAVNRILQMIDLIEDRFEITPASRIICICDTTYLPGIYNGILYTGSSELYTQEFGACLIQYIFGPEVNYGLCYALGVELMQAMGGTVEGTEGTIEDALKLCDDAPVYLDMNYACFLSAYADEVTLSRVKTLALDFYHSLAQDEKIELFSDYSNVLYRKKLNAYLNAHGKTSYDNTDLDGIIFYPCGGKIRLAWEDPYAEFYLYDDYTVMYGFQGSDLDYVNSGYENLRYLVRCYCLQAAEMERTAGHLEQEDRVQKVPVLLVRDPATERYAGCAYYMSENLIKLFYLDGYAHEYVHYLTRDAVPIKAWLLELLPCYCTQQPGEPMIAWNASAARESYENLDPKDPADADAYAFYAAVTEHLDHPFDWNDPEDFRYFYDAYMVAYNQFDRIKTRGGLIGHGAFAQYLASLAGEQAMMEAIYNNTPVEIFGKNWDALIDEWQEKLIGEHGWILN